MMDVGRVCVKIAGRDAGQKCVITDVLDNHMVEIDGETRRRKVNIRHLEPTRKVLKLKKKASRADVKKAFKSELDIELQDRKSKKPKEKPTRKRQGKKATAKKGSSEKPKTSKKKTSSKKE